MLAADRDSDRDRSRRPIRFCSWCGLSDRASRRPSRSRIAADSRVSPDNIPMALLGGVGRLHVHPWSGLFAVRQLLLGEERALLALLGRVRGQRPGAGADCSEPVVRQPRRGNRRGWLVDDPDSAAENCSRASMSRWARSPYLSRTGCIALLERILCLGQIGPHTLLAGGHVAPQAETLSRLLLLQAIEAAVDCHSPGRQRVKVLLQPIEDLGACGTCLRLCPLLRGTGPGGLGLRGTGGLARGFRLSDRPRCSFRR